MNKTHYIVIIVIIAQAFLLVILYNSKFDSGSDILVGFTDSRKQAGEAPKENIGSSRVKYKNNIDKYVDSVNSKVIHFRENADFKNMPPEKKRMKLIEYFTLHIADADYTLLGEDEQKEIMTEFLRRYAPEK